MKIYNVGRERYIRYMYIPTTSQEQFGVKEKSV